MKRGKEVRKDRNCAGYGAASDARDPFCALLFGVTLENMRARRNA